MTVVPDLKDKRRASARTDPLTAALEYAGRGWSVVPIDPEKKKTPYGLPWKPYQRKRATERELRAWWAKWPRARVGIVTGRVSGLVVVDIDGPAGEASAAELELPETLEDRSGRLEGGRRLFYAIPPGARARGRVDVRKGIDVRGERGLLVLAPSMHASGKRYAWTNELEPAPAPAWLLEDERENVGTLHTPTVVRIAHSGSQRPEMSPWARAALERECERVSRATKGNRNEELNLASIALAEIVAGGELEEVLARRELVAAAERCELVADDGLRTVKETIRSGFRKGRGNPRWAPRPAIEPAPARTKQRAHVARKARAMREALDRYDWPKRSHSQRRIVEAFITQSEALGADSFQWDVRSVAVAAGVSRGTAAAHLRKLGDWVRPDYVVRERGSRLEGRATWWVLRVPFGTSSDSHCTTHQKQGLSPSYSDGKEKTVRGLPVSPALDLWRWAGAGHARRRVFEVLASAPTLSVAELAEELKIDPSGVRKHLAKLEEYGLAMRDGRTWTACVPNEGERRRLEDDLNVSGAGVQQQQRHAIEREKNREHLADIAEPGKLADFTAAQERSRRRRAGKDVPPRTLERPELERQRGRQVAERVRR